MPLRASRACDRPAKPGPSHTRPTSFLQRFSARISVDPKSGCHIWTGGRDVDGYGRYVEGGHEVRAHRAAWADANGCPVPEGNVVRHRCHNPACVNPEHLAIGTQAENIQDRQTANRQAKGSNNGRSKLTERQIKALKRVMKDGGVPRARLARMLDVDPSTLRDIKQGKLWGWVEAE